MSIKDGLPHTVIDAKFKPKYLWWNAYAQVDRFEDCSGKSTYYRYDERQHLIAVTDALNQTTTLERKPDGEVLRIHHPDGTAESFTYKALGQVSFLRQRPYCGQRARPGEIKYEYEANGQLHCRDTGSLVDNKEFRYDPAANRPDFNARQSTTIRFYMRWNEIQLVHDGETSGD